MIYIDAHNYLKRIYHAGGNPYSLFYDMMIKHQDKKVKLVCDTSTSRKYRKSIHPGYKAGRNQGDDPVYWEVYNNCKEMALEFANVSIVEVTDGEADDYINLTTKEGDTVISNDKDLWPLIKRGVTILLNASTKVDEELVQVKFRASPKHILLYKALVGDPSDKIPGKRGFGPAAWDRMNFEDRELYTHHFSIGNCTYDPKIMTEQACMSWKLALPYIGFEFNVKEGHDGDALQYCREKEIIL